MTRISEAEYGRILSRNLDIDEPNRTVTIAESVIRRAPPNAPERTEHEEQVAVIRWAHNNEHRWNGALRWLAAIPNGGQRDLRVAVKLKAEGVKSGVPDLALYVPRHGYHGLLIELKKAVKPAAVSPQQKEWIAGLTENGYAVALCYGAEQAINAIREYLEN